MAGGAGYFKTLLTALQACEEIPAVLQTIRSSCARHFKSSDTDFLSGLRPDSLTPVGPKSVQSSLISPQDLPGPPTQNTAPQLM